MEGKQAHLAQREQQVRRILLLLSLLVIVGCADDGPTHAHEVCQPSDPDFEECERGGEDEKTPMWLFWALLFIFIILPGEKTK